jgi:hypothetical protein
MKTIFGKLFLVLVFCFSIVGISFAVDNTSPAELQESAIGINLTYLGFHVNNMPLEIRNIPNHRDDTGYERNQGPIEQKEYDINYKIDLSFMCVNEWPRVKLNIGADWMILPWIGMNEAERNYMNSPGSDTRGEGAALTYVDLRQVGVIPSTGYPFVDLFLNWTPRVTLEVAPFDGPFDNLWLGVSGSYCAYVAQSGWDRNNDSEVRKNYVLMHTFPVRTYATMMFGEKKTSALTLGLEFEPGSKTDMGEQADIAFSSPTFFLGYSHYFK